MNKEQKEVWKKLADDTMRIEPEVEEYITKPMRTHIDELKERFDKRYSLIHLSVVVDPTTFEPMVIFYIRYPDTSVRKLRLDIESENPVFITG